MQGGRPRWGVWIILKVVLKIFYKVSHGKWAFKWSPTRLVAAISLPCIQERHSYCTPLLLLPLSTFWRGRELSQNYISLAVSRTSGMLHSHWLLEAPGGAGEGQ